MKSDMVRGYDTRHHTGARVSAPSPVLGSLEGASGPQPIGQSGHLEVTLGGQELGDVNHGDQGMGLLSTPWHGLDMSPNLMCWKQSPESCVHGVWRVGLL